jgi:hypothetical protein
MAKDFESLKQQALVIKNEVEDGANSSERVGGILEDMLDYNEEKRKELSNKTAGVNYVTCETAASTAAKTVSITGLTSLTTGIRLLVKMTNNNTASNATLNINSLGAKPLYYDNERASSDNSWEAGEVIDVYYDGTNFYSSNVQGGSSDGGNKILEWKSDADTTRKQVPLKDRKELLQISYKDGEGNSINEQYIGTAFDDTSWADDSNWNRIYDSQYHPIGEGKNGVADFIVGYAINANTGEKTSYNSNWKYCEVRVSGYSTITCDVAYSSSGIGIAFYGKDGAFISGFTKYTDNYGENVSVDIPDGAVTAKWAWSDVYMSYKSEGKYVLSKNGNIPSENITYKEGTQKDFNDKINEFVENKGDENIAKVTLYNAINASTGDVISEGAWEYFETNVAGHKKLYCKVGFANNKTSCVGLAFYDADGDYISGYYKIIFEGSEDVELDIPDNAVTAKWSWLLSKANENNGEYKFDSELHIDASKVKYGSQTQSEFNDSISNKDLTEKTYQAESTNSYYINSTNGDIGYSDPWKYYEADVEGCKTLSCKVGRGGSTSYSIGLAFYDDSDTYISGYSKIGNNMWDYVTLDVPDNAATVRWSWLKDDTILSPSTSNNGEYTVTKEKSLSDDSDVIDHNTVNLLVADQIEKTFNDGTNDFTPPNDGYSMSNRINVKAGDWITRTGTETGMIVVTDENDTNGQRLYKSDGSTLGASFQIPKDMDWVRYIRLAVEEEGANDGSVVICKGKYAFTGSEKGDFLTIPKLRVEKRNLTNDLLYIKNEDGSKYFKVYVDTDGNIKAKEVELAISDSELPTNWKTLTLQGSFNGYFDRFVIMNTDFLIDLSEDGPMKIKAISPALTNMYSNFEHFYTSGGKGRYVVDTAQNVVTNGKGITIFDGDFNKIETNIT